MEATIVDLRYRMKDVLSAIDRGEIVTVLYRGLKKGQAGAGRSRVGQRRAKNERPTVFRHMA